MLYAKETLESIFSQCRLLSSAEQDGFAQIQASIRTNDENTSMKLARRQRRNMIKKQHNASTKRRSIRRKPCKVKTTVWKERSLTCWASTALQCKGKARNMLCDEIFTPLKAAGNQRANLTTPPVTRTRPRLVETRLF